MDCAGGARRGGISLRPYRGGFTQVEVTLTLGHHLEGRGESLGNKAHPHGVADVRVGAGVKQSSGGLRAPEERGDVESSLKCGRKNHEQPSASANLHGEPPGPPKGGFGTAPC